MTVTERRTVYVTLKVTEVGGLGHTRRSSWRLVVEKDGE